MPTLAVTGGSGFIGQRLIERCGQDGIAVRALMRNRPVQAKGDHLTVIQGQLGDDAAIGALIDGVDAVVHLAGLIKARTRQAFFTANADGVQHLATLIAQKPLPPKLVFVSSLAAREPTLSSYAASKHAGEQALAAHDKLPWTILRPPAVYGPGDRETLSFFKGIKRGVGAMLGNDQARFSLLHVDDLVDLIMTVLHPTIADRQTFEPDDGQDGGHGWQGMITAAEQAFGKSVLRFRVPAALLRLIGHANAGLRVFPGYTPMLTPEKVRELTHPDWVANRHEIQVATGWNPRIPVNRGFPATIDWYQLHSWL